MSDETIRERISNVGSGVTPIYHATESVEEAKAVVEQCGEATGKRPKCLDLMDAIEEVMWWCGVNTLRFNYKIADLTELLKACAEFKRKYEVDDA